MKAARVLCRFLLLLLILFQLVLFLPTGFSSNADGSLDEGPRLQITSIQGNLEDSRPSSIFVVLQNNASPNNESVEPGFNKGSARNIVARLRSADEGIRIFSGPQNVGLLAAGENTTVQFMAQTEGAALGIYPLQLYLNYSRLSQVTISGDKNIPNFAFAYERAVQELPLQVKVVQGPKIEQEELEGETLPGIESNLRIVLANRGDLPAQDIQIQARPTFPFLMIENDQEKASLSPGESASLRLSIFTDENTTSGYYALPCRISYRDGQNGEIRSQDLAVLIYVGEDSSFPWLYLVATGLILLILAGSLYALKRIVSGQRRIRIVKS
ncbi:MAG: hypothetical protein PHN61_03470 [Methanothrix sp.]|nr:hypothetical protein [Methanothrix sp.]